MLPLCKVWLISERWTDSLTAWTNELTLVALPSQLAEEESIALLAPSVIDGFGGVLGYKI